MAGITIPIATDTRQAVKGTDAIADGFDKVADALDDTAKGAETAGERIERSLRDAQRETRDTATEYQKLARAQKQAGSDSTADFEFSAREKRKISKETIDEIGNEAKQNAAETFSSFDGSAQSFVDGVQGTLGGLVSSLGPVGLAIGAAGALGIGLINGALQNADTNSQQFKADVADLTQALIDAGNTGEVSLDRVVQVLQKLATTGDESGVTLEKLDNLTRRSRNSFDDVAEAYAGNTSALKDLVRAGKERLEQLQREGAAIDTSAGAHGQHAASITDEANAQKELNSYLDQASQKAEAAAKNAELYAKSGAADMQAKAEAIRNIDQAYDDAAGGASDYVDAETGVFNTDAYIDAMQKKAQALDDFKTNMQKAALTLSPEAQQFLESQGEDASATLVAAYVNGTDAQKAQLAAIWNTAGKTSADSYTASLRAGLPPTMQGPSIIIDDVNTAPILRQIQQTLDGHTFKVNAYATVRAGNAVLG